MEIRLYEPRDCGELARLFYETVHKVCCKDYTPAQLDAWAPAPPDTSLWHKSLTQHYTLVAQTDGILVGFGDLDPAAGYLDRLYVHAQYQGRGVGTLLCQGLEAKAKGALVTHASITAWPFFAHRGYRVLKHQQVERNGIYLTNFVMEKNL